MLPGRPVPTALPPPNTAAPKRTADLQDAGAGVEVATRRSTALPGRPLRAMVASTDGRQARSAVSGNAPVPRTRTSVTVSQPAKLCCVQSPNPEPTDYPGRFDRRNYRCPAVSASKHQLKTGLFQH